MWPFKSKQRNHLIDANEAYYRDKVIARLLESNSLFGNQVLANQLLTSKGQGQWQLLYSTISDSTAAGQQVDISRCTRNSTIIACMNWKSRAFAQMTPMVMYKNADTGQYEKALESDAISKQDKQKAKQVQNLLNHPNHFQSTYEFLAQCSMWLDLTGELFILNWRENQNDPVSTPLEIYVMDTTLMTARVNANRYPAYRNSGPMYGFGKDTEFADHQITHVLEGPWQGASGFNKLIQASELVNLSQSIDEYSNYVLRNAAKPSGTFTSEQPIADGKLKEIAARLKESWNSLTGSRDQDFSKPGQAMIMESGFKYTPIAPPTLQDMDTAKLKQQVDSRICGLMGVPAQFVGINTESKFNNSLTIRDEAYRSTLYPLLKMLSAKFDRAFFPAYPNLKIDWDCSEFLKGALLDSASFTNSLVGGGIMTVNEARAHLDLPKMPNMDVLQPAGMAHAEPDGDEPDIGNTGQDTGGGGGSPPGKAQAPKSKTPLRAVA